MNRKQIAIKVSKHPLVKKLLESKAATPSDIARLVVEELLSENVEQFAQKINDAEDLNSLRKIKKELDEAGGSWESNHPELRILYVQKEQKLMKSKIKAMSVTLKGMLPGIIDEEREYGLNYMLNYATEIEEMIEKVFNKTLKEHDSDLFDLVTKAKETLKKISEPKTKTAKEEPEMSEEDSRKLLFIFTIFGQMFSPTNPLQESEDPEYQDIYDDFFTDVLDIHRSHRKKMEEFMSQLRDEGLRTDFIRVLKNPLVVKRLKELLEQSEIDWSKPPEEPAEEEPAADETDAEEDAETEEPSPQPTQPEEKVEINPQNFKDFKEAAENFTNTFYKQRFKKKQGELVLKLIAALENISSTQELEVAFFEEPEPEEEITEADEAKEEIEIDKEELSDIKLAFRTLIRNIDTVHDIDTKSDDGVLKKFYLAAEEGKIITPILKRKLIELIERIQNSIPVLVRSLEKIKRPKLEEAPTREEEISQKAKQATEIQKAFKELTTMLQNIIDAGDKEELAVREVANAIEQLREISPYFPNVNPFGIEKPDFKGLASSFEKAVQEVRPSLRRILDMQKTSEVSEGVIPTIIADLKAFSESILNIFNVKSKYEELNEPEVESVESDEEDTEETPDEVKPEEKTPKDYLEQFKDFLFSKITPSITEDLQEVSRRSEKISDLKQFFIEKLHSYLTSYSEGNEKYKKWLQSLKLRSGYKQWIPLAGLWDAWLESEYPNKKQGEEIENKIFSAYRKSFFKKPKLTGKQIRNIFSDEDLEEQITNKLKPLVREIIRRTK